ncbi:MAG: hypothetical protein L0Y66_21605 [Myxococcaceae bacterium]|nr:hypothetical protein [Myxococcaceae bacterium]MCI0671275.1 hypothetical protein [Myxococcaceae bacterium]
MSLPHHQSIPLGAATSGDLRLLGGASYISLRAAKPVEGPHGEPQPLFAARFHGPLPEVHAHGGSVDVAYSRFHFWWPPHHGREADIALTGAVPWRMQFRGGVGVLEADLRALQLLAFDFQWGVNDLRLVLPRPSGTVPLRIRGGVNRLTLLRPAGVPMRLTVRGGTGSLRVDTLSLGSVGGTLAWESPDFAGATDRLDVEVLGGLNHATFGAVESGPCA